MWDLGFRFYNTLVNYFNKHLNRSYKTLSKYKILSVYGLPFGVKGLGFRVSCLGFRF